jgi:Mn2+/Fe2+ NRAMP family transporter
VVGLGGGGGPPDVHVRHGGIGIHHLFGVPVLIWIIIIATIIIAVIFIRRRRKAKVQEQLLTMKSG